MSVRPTSRAASCMRLASAGPAGAGGCLVFGALLGRVLRWCGVGAGLDAGPDRAARGCQVFKRAETKETVKGLVEQGAVDRGLGQRGAQRALEQGAVAPTHQFDGTRRIDLGVEMDFKVAAAQRLEKVFKRGLHGDSPHPCALVAAGWTSARWRWRCLART